MSYSQEDSLEQCLQEAEESELAQLLQQLHETSGNIQYRERDHPHSKLSANALAKIVIITKDTARIDGLPSDIKHHALKTQDWYGQFGKVISVKLDAEQKRGSMTAAFIQFTNQDSTDIAIEATNNGYFNSKFHNDRVLKARYATNKYCSKSIHNKPCYSHRCTALHQWIPAKDFCDVYVADDKLFKEYDAIPYGVRKQVLTGVCKIYRATKGFGFITCDDGSDDVFVNIADIKDFHGQLYKGAKLRFEIGKPNNGQRQRKAKNVTVIENEMPLKRMIVNAKYDNGRIKGICTSFNAVKGFGFIAVNDGGMVFVHKSAVSAFNGTLHGGETLEFNLLIEPDGRRRAVNVTGPNGTIHHAEMEQYEQRIYALRQELDTSERKKQELMMKNTNLLGQLNLKTSENESMLINMNALLTENQNVINEAKAESETLKKENKELSGKIMEIRQTQNERDQLEMEYVRKLRQIHHKLWNTKDIVIWIVNLDKDNYGKYRDVLSENLMNEEVDGSCLKDINRNDLCRFGIKLFKDNNDIWNKMQRLIMVDKMKDRSRDNGECLICMDAPKDYACVPCGHQCLCVNCKDKVHGICPVCLKECSLVIKIFK